MDIEEYNPALCPLCGSDRCETGNRDAERTVRYCHDCNSTFVLWFDEPYDEMPIEVTDIYMNHIL